MKNVFGVDYEWGHDAKGLYTKITMEKAVKKLVEVYENNTGSDVKFHKNPVDHGTALSKSDLEELHDINNFRSFVVQLM